MRIDSTVATKKLFFSPCSMLDFQIPAILLRDFQANPFRNQMSFSDSSTQDPRYLKSFFCSSSVPRGNCRTRGGWLSMVQARHLVLGAIETKTYFVAFGLYSVEELLCLLHSFRQ